MTWTLAVLQAYLAKLNLFTRLAYPMFIFPGTKRLCEKVIMSILRIFKKGHLIFNKKLQSSPAKFWLSARPLGVSWNAHDGTISKLGYFLNA